MGQGAAAGADVDWVLVSSMTYTERQAQQAQFIRMTQRLGGAALHMRLNVWVRSFGMLTSEHPWGRHIWSGTHESFSRYPYRYLFGRSEELLLGWFACPSPFGRAAALMPFDLDPVGTPTAAALVSDYYPAIFYCSSEGNRMACLAIFVQCSRPRWVHSSRLVSCIPLRNLWL